MSTMSSVGSGSSAWPDLGNTRASARKEGMFGMFERADAHGDGTVDFAQQRLGAPPPDGPPPAAASSNGSSASTTTDPLDANGDGTVSAQERAVGELSQADQSTTTLSVAA